ncbi:MULTISPECIES: cytochrome P450 [Mycolicibacterium]|uniref:Cytochrome P450 n=3 Tax=Mycolicibacterium gilvum TaxID=1804 RepID=E6TKJ1_MYCSR|nr:MULTISPECIES: cytochrome P450 [Mycolicibacterium]ABP43741.1 cytochrome P450 [Mycolicibacterium gilvum PYR-GCK]ADU01457.1 cytochrome P450 [Mycolicibacterium gilvum Spyr1]MBV5242007.1 cytochrome P450 [Mycolicibacterium sp. PAM1]MCV7058145.1 cytochrome P450 [Mycolicibacterium gilvum]STZ46026.1 cytochrome P450 [Mycolicibacterium gilvum]
MNPETLRYDFDRHRPDYRDRFLDITHEMHQQCPLAWTDTYDGHWVAASSDAVFELARCPFVSNDHDVNNERRGYKGISIPRMLEAEGFRGGMLEMDDPEHRHYRTALNPYLSPAAVKRWEPFVDEIVCACLDDRIESGRIDFVDDLANVVPAVLTLAMLGVPLQKWEMYNEPAHASVYTPPDSPDAERVRELYMAMGIDLFTNLMEIRDNPRPGIINALATLRIDGEAPPDIELIGMLNLLIGGGFDTTTALTAHALEWLSEHPDERARLSADRDTLLNPATEEFLRYFTPAPGDARTIAEDVAVNGVELREGQRLWLSWAMANRDPAVFTDPDQIVLDRKGNRHFSFGLGVHRCIGSNVARTVFKSMLTAVLDRMPDYRCLPKETVHYDSIGVIQGMRHLPAEFTPGPRRGAGVAETVARLQKICDEQGLARPITELKDAARIEEAV